MKLQITTLLITVAALGASTEGAPSAQDPPSPAVIEVTMTDRGGGQWRFEPSEIEVHMGDVVRFVQADIVPHNVQFKDSPADANLGALVMGPFLIQKGQTYEVTIDDRFVPGEYAYVCTPHEMLGMKATLTVTP